MVKVFRDASGNKDQTREDRVGLIFEELDELKSAIEDNDKIEMVDAIVDMTYFAMDELALRGCRFNSSSYIDISSIIYSSIIGRSTINFNQLEDMVNTLSSRYVTEDIDCSEYNTAIIILVMSYVASLEDELSTLTPRYFDAVHMSNMSKICTTYAGAQSAVDAYAEGTHPYGNGIAVDTYINPHEDQFVILRKSDDKVMKSLSWKKPGEFL